jgi:hypothetical protein
MLQLPTAPPVNFSPVQPGQAIVGLQIDPGPSVQPVKPGNNFGSFLLLQGGAVSGIHDSVAGAEPISPNSLNTGNLTPASPLDYFQLPLTQPGQMTARVHASGLMTRLSLLDSAGNLLVQSDGQSFSNLDDLIVQTLDVSPQGTAYYLKVESLNGATGAYSLSVAFAPTAVPSQLPLRDSPLAVVAGDFNGDGIPDLVTANAFGGVAVFLGNGDGTFQLPREFAVLGSPVALVNADFNNDGSHDVATANASGTISGLLGNHDGTFQPAKIFSAVQHTPVALVTADFNGDGIPDLAVADASGTVSLFLGKGDGTFSPGATFSLGTPLSAMLTAHLHGGGIADLVVATASGTVTVLLGDGKGSFHQAGQFSVGHPIAALVSADFNGDSLADLAAASPSGTVTVLLGNGKGGFGQAKDYAMGGSPTALLAADLNGDGIPDLITANTSGTVSVLLGKGKGVFQPATQISVGASPVALAAADFNGDGIADLVTANGSSGTVTVLLGKGQGAFQAPEQLAVGLSPVAEVTADFNNDGIPDLADITAAPGVLSVFLGKGKGNYQLAATYLLPPGLVALATADFNGDGVPDLAVAQRDLHSGNLFVFVGKGDGTFQAQPSVPLTDPPQSLVTADFNGDGIVDLASANRATHSISVFLGKGDGTFQKPRTFSLAGPPNALLAADFNGDGLPDLAAFVASPINGIEVFLGNGDGTFRLTGPPLPVTGGTVALVSADFNGDGIPDLAAANVGAGNVSVFLGNGDGTFQAPTNYSVDGSPAGLVVADFNNNGIFDLATSNAGTDDVSVLLGTGTGAFQQSVSFAVGGSPAALATGDFNGDGLVGLATANRDTDSVSVLLGASAFLSALPGQASNALVSTAPLNPLSFSQRYSPQLLASADLNGDQRLDLVSANASTGIVSVFLGDGDGTFTALAPLQVAAPVRAIVIADLNGDGIPDLAIASASGTVSVFLGNGDGTFQPPKSFPVGASPNAMLVADFNGDHKLDLATANASGTVSVLLGNGDGTFQPPKLFAVGNSPLALVAADLNGDGIIDLATANAASNTVSVLLGNGNGTFGLEKEYPVGSFPSALVAADLNGDGIPDLAIANAGSGDVSVLLGQPDQKRKGMGTGTFEPLRGSDGQPLRFPVGTTPSSLVGGDFNGDGIFDLASANPGSGDLSVLVGNGDGTFKPKVSYALSQPPSSLILGDFNRDGHLDLLTAHTLSAGFAVLLGAGDGTFQTASTIRSTPLVADFYAHGVDDVAVLTGSGEILLRKGRPDAPGLFDPPVLINPDPASLATDLTVVLTPRGALLAALDASTPSITLYGLTDDGSFGKIDSWLVPITSVTPRPVRIVAGDLEGNGRADLVVAEDITDQVLIYRQQADGRFDHTPIYQVPVGISPSDVILADVNSDHLLDIVVSNQESGDISILLNGTKGPFTTALRFRAATGAYNIANRDGSPASRIEFVQSGALAQLALAPTLTGPPVISSDAATVGVVAGRFDENRGIGLITLNNGFNAFSLLEGTGTGGFFNPLTFPGYATGQGPVAIVAADFNHDGHLDLAILNELSDTVTIFLGDGQGGFTAQVPLSAGNQPTGLAVADINGDGNLDLLVGNAYGDVLVLLGNGDGTFRPFVRTDQKVTLAAADLNHQHRDDFALANQSADQLLIQ